MADIITIFNHSDMVNMLCCNEISRILSSWQNNLKNSTETYQEWRETTKGELNKRNKYWEARVCRDGIRTESTKEIPVHLEIALKITKAMVFWKQKAE